MPNKIGQNRLHAFQPKFWGSLSGKLHPAVDPVSDSCSCRLLFFSVAVKMEGDYARKIEHKVIH